MTTPEVKILSRHPTELAAVLYEVGTGYDEAAGSKTEFTLTDSDRDESIVFNGSGFAYRGDGTPKHGGVTSMTIQVGGHDYAKISNVGLSLTKIFHFIQTGNPQGLYDLFGSMGFTGGRADDFILTGKGDDHIHGGGGDDTIAAGAGADNIYGGKGSDTVDYSTAKADGVFASLTDPSLNTHDAEGDTYHSIENLLGSSFDDVLVGDSNGNILTGANGADSLNGGKGADALSGDGGDDFLAGGKDADNLFGGAGGDIFFYQRSDLALSGEADTIFGWDNHDKIGIDAASFGHGLDSAQGVTPDQFHRDHAVGHNAQFVYFTDGGNLVWDVDGDGPGLGIVIATIDGAPALSRGDITILIPL